MIPARVHLPGTRILADQVLIDMVVYAASVLYTENLKVNQMTPLGVCSPMSKMTPLTD